MDHFRRFCQNLHGPQVRTCIGKLCAFTCSSNVPKLPGSNASATASLDDDDEALEDHEVVLEVETHHEVVLQVETHHEVVLQVETRHEVVLQVETRHGAVSQMPRMKAWGTWVLARMQQLTQPPVWQLTQPPRTA